MQTTVVFVKRETKETQIEIELDMDGKSPISIDTPLPFFNHLLEAFSFHGGFGLRIKARGDIEVDPHHLVEDTGLVLGTALNELFQKRASVKRFSHKIIPMDEALSEVIIDVCNRPTLVYHPVFPQEKSGDFDLSLLREFFLALTAQAKISLHLIFRHGENSHHMIEAMFKALGKAVFEAYSSNKGGEESMSTKGKI